MAGRIGSQATSSAAEKHPRDPADGASAEETTVKRTKRGQPSGTKDTITANGTNDSSPPGSNGAEGLGVGNPAQQKSSQAGSTSPNESGVQHTGGESDKDKGVNQGTLPESKTDDGGVSIIHDAKDSTATGSEGGLIKAKDNNSLLLDPAVCFVRYKWFSNDLMKRLPPMLQYASKRDHMFALSAIPLGDLDWGSTPSSDGKLCISGGNIPVNVWVVGTIVSTYLFDQQGDPVSRITIKVKPLTEHATMVARNIVSHHSRPATAPSSTLIDIAASRWMSVRVPGERASQILEFERVYDATTKYGAKSAMKQIAAEKLKKGDLVLMETQVSRYDSMKDNGKGKRRAWKPSDFVEWKVTFDLMAVSLLVAGPKVFDDGEGVPDIVDADFAL